MKVSSLPFAALIMPLWIASTSAHAGCPYDSYADCLQQTNGNVNYCKSVALNCMNRQDEAADVLPTCPSGATYAECLIATDGDWEWCKTHARVCDENLPDTDDACGALIDQSGFAECDPSEETHITVSAPLDIDYSSTVSCPYDSYLDCLIETGGDVDYCKSVALNCDEGANVPGSVTVTFDGRQCVDELCAGPGDCVRIPCTCVSGAGTITLVGTTTVVGDEVCLEVTGYTVDVEGFAPPGAQAEIEAQVEAFLAENDSVLCYPLECL